MCDLYDATITAAYDAINDEESATWLTLGLRDNITQTDKLEVNLNVGQDIHKLYEHLDITPDALYGLVHVSSNKRLYMFTFLPTGMSYDRKIRARNYEDAIKERFSEHDCHIVVSTTDDLYDQICKDVAKGQYQPLDEHSLSQDGPSYSVASTPMTEHDEHLPFTPNMHQIGEQYSESDGDEEEEELQREELVAEAEAKRSAEEDEERRHAEKERQEATEREQQKRAEEERAERERAMEQERFAREEQERLAEEQRATEAKKRNFEKQFQEAKDANIIYYGVASVQPSSSPFWRRRFIVIRGNSLLLYNEEKIKTPASIVALHSSKQAGLSTIDQEDTFMPNSIILDTPEGPLKIHADNKSDVETFRDAINKAVTH